jgi:hypothetical protein
MMQEKSGGIWGPEGGAGWSIIFNAPYTPTEGCIELKWAVGKGYVAHPDRQTTNRSVGTVIKQLRTRWYNGYINSHGVQITEAQECFRLVEHCERVMQHAIDADYTEFGESEACVHGNLFCLNNVPEDLTAWKKLAGMDKYVEFALNLDTMFCGDPFTDVQEPEEESEEEEEAL